MRLPAGGGGASVRWVAPPLLVVGGVALSSPAPPLLVVGGVALSSPAPPLLVVGGVAVQLLLFLLRFKNDGS